MLLICWSVARLCLWGRVLGAICSTMLHCFLSLVWDDFRTEFKRSCSNAYNKNWVMVKSLCLDARILNLFALVLRYMSAMPIHVAFAYTQFSVVCYMYLHDICIIVFRAWFSKASQRALSVVSAGVTGSGGDCGEGLRQELPVPGIVFGSSPTRSPPCSSIGRRFYRLPSLPPTSPYYKLRGCQAPGSMLNCISG